MDCAACALVEACAEGSLRLGASKDGRAICCTECHELPSAPPPGDDDADDGVSPYTPLVMILGFVLLYVLLRWSHFRRPAVKLKIGNPTREQVEESRKQEHARFALPLEAFSKPEQSPSERSRDRSTSGDASPSPSARGGSTGSRFSGVRRRGKQMYNQMKRKLNEQRRLEQQATDSLPVLNTRWEPNETDTPLICMVNPRSGGQAGKAAFYTLRALLSKAQVFTLLPVDDEPFVPPVEVLARFLELEQLRHRLRVLVAGGDGTVGWVCQLVDEAKQMVAERAGRPLLPFDVPMAILPLGTGNDLSRTLGWGGSVPINPRSLKRYLVHLTRAIPAPVDRWVVTVELEEERQKKTDEGLQRKTVVKLLKKHDMLGYIGLGVDAQVVGGFDSLRKVSPWMFISSKLNKIHYILLGLISSIRRQHAVFHELVDVRLDDEWLSLPEGSEGFVCSNISSYGGGGKLERSPGALGLNMGDRQIDCLSAYGSDHLGMVNVGLSEATRVGRAHEVDVRVHGYPGLFQYHVDGEPEHISPFTGDLVVKIRHRDQVHLLRKVKSAERRATAMLQAAVEDGIITLNLKHKLTSLMHKLEEKEEERIRRKARVSGNTLKAVQSLVGLMSEEESDSDFEGDQDVTELRP